MSRPILVAEDTENERILLKYAAKEAGLSAPLAIVPDGAEVIAYLRGDPPYTDRQAHPFPRLVLLDLKMPRLTGLEALAWIRQHPAFEALPVLMFSSSGQDEDVQDAYRLGVEAYITKPHLQADFVRIIRLIDKYWIQMPAPPPGSREWLSILTQPPPDVGSLRPANSSFH